MFGDTNKNYYIKDMKVKVRYYTPIVNFPDLQQRIYVNSGVVKWKNKVHEVLEGNDFFGIFPNHEEICILHHKDIKRQEQQNNYYDTL